MMNKGLNKNQIVIYVFFGVLTTLINWIVYISILSLGIGINYANALAWIVAVVFAFITNKLFVFGSQLWGLATLRRELGLFFSARILSGIIEILGFSLLLSIGLDKHLFGVRGMYSKLAISVLVIIVNYILSKEIIFKKGGNSIAKRSE